MKFGLPQIFECGMKTKFAMKVMECALQELGDHERLIGNGELGYIDSMVSGLDKTVTRIIRRMPEQKHKRVAMRETPPFPLFNQFPADPLTLKFRKHSQRP
jgi:hypothetical protein